MARRDGHYAGESRAFLFDHGYTGLQIRAYTSRSWDAERAKRGLPPLSGQPPGQTHVPQRA